LNLPLLIGIAALLVLLFAMLALFLRRRQRLDRRLGRVRQLLQLADRMEADLRICRSGLLQAHAVMSLNPDLPAAGEAEARQAIDAGLRALLQQRIWIRDQASRASEEELDQAVDAMTANRDRLEPLLHALDQARGELDDAMREHIRREPHA
jgi:hypothetical protein